MGCWGSTACEFWRGGGGLLCLWVGGGGGGERVAVLVGVWAAGPAQHVGAALDVVREQGLEYFCGGGGGLALTGKHSRLLGQQGMWWSARGAGDVQVTWQGPCH